MGKLWMIGLLLFTLIADCIKESTGPEDGVPTELVGTWYATAFTFLNPANPSQTVNLIQSGFSFTLVIAGDGSFTATEVIPGIGTDVTTSTAVVSGSQITITDPEDTTVLAWVIIDNVLTLTSQDEEFDFNGDNVDEPAILTIVLSMTQSDAGDPVPSEAIGTWDATSFRYVNLANTSQTEEAITGGAGFTLVIGSDGSFSAVFTNSDGSTEPDSGSLAFNGNQVIATSPTEVEIITWMISGNTMTLTFITPMTMAAIKDRIRPTGSSQSTDPVHVFSHPNRFRRRLVCHQGLTTKRRPGVAPSAKVLVAW